MTPTQSYWGVQGWAVSTSVVSGNQCFEAFPPNNSTTVHHIIFANNIANGCGDGAFTTGSSGSAGVDYLAIIGNIAYNGAQDNANCYSGIDIVEPVNSDTLPGTHIYIAGNFSWGNVNPNPCGGGLPTDGQGISLDTVNGVEYSGQIVIENNISIFNGGTGIQSFLNTGGNPNAPIYIKNNTTYGNQTGSINANPCAEVNLNISLSTQVFNNLIQTGASTGCHQNIGIYTLGVVSPDSTDVVFTNFGYSAAGNNTIGSGTGFSFGPNNIFGSTPQFANPVQPPAPDCTGASSVPDCMAQVVSNFTPTNQNAIQYGYQKPNASMVFNSLFPQWLCSVTNLPPGLIAMGCLTASTTATGIGGIGQLSGNSLQTSVINPKQLDLFQAIRKGGAIVWSLSSQGVSTINPSNPTSDALLARVQGESFMDAVHIGDSSDAFQVKNSNGLIVFRVDSNGTSHGS